MATDQSPKQRINLDEPPAVDLDLDFLDGQPEEPQKVRTFKSFGHVYAIPADTPLHLYPEICEIAERGAALEGTVDEADDSPEALELVDQLHGLIVELVQIVDPSVTRVLLPGPKRVQDLLSLVNWILDVDVGSAPQPQPKMAVPKSRRASGSRSGAKAARRGSSA